MKKGIILFLGAVLILFAAWIGSTYNNLIKLDETVSASWAQVLNQYNRRADLIGNLVSTVQGYAKHEEGTLKEVTALRAQAQKGGVSLADPKAIESYQKTQSQLTSVLSRLMVVVEKYPDLKANQNFLTLQSQLEGTENRITIARKDYIEAVRQFNMAVRQIPANFVTEFFGMKPKETFSISSSDEQLPLVKFN